MHARSGRFPWTRWRSLPALAGLAAAIPLAALLAAPPALSQTSASALAAAGSSGGLIVRTTDGKLRGRHAEGVDQFLGVPYAAPPVGALRWQAPQPAQPWTGVRDATSYGNRCPQLASGNGPREDTEDCLFLNVFAPAGGPGRAAAHGGAGRGLPVLFMIHGGGLANGAGDQHDGSLIVKTDHIIVVSINYRLDVFGFLDVPGLGTMARTANGNYGLLDQEAALGWVHRNIARFGGNPDQVTIAGESAGGWSVCALMTSPLARGLFHGAISESGSCPSQTPAQARTAGLAFAAQGLPDAATAASCLRNTPEFTLLTASASYSPQFVSGGPELPLPPLTAVADGDYTRVPLLMATNHDEERTFTQGFASYTEQQYVQFVEQSYGTKAPAILQHYPWAAYPARTPRPTPSGRSGPTAVVEGIGGCPTRTWPPSSPAGRPRSSTSSTTGTRPR